MENGRKGSDDDRRCDECIFFDVCIEADVVCAHFYSIDPEEWLDAGDERERKIEYLVEWETYIGGF